MTHPFRHFIPPVYVVVAVLIAAALVTQALLLVSERHERRRLEVALCTAHLAALAARGPMAQRVAAHADPCLAPR
jgi:hypothetical protein